VPRLLPEERNDIKEHKKEGAGGTLVEVFTSKRNNRNVIKDIMDLGTELK
jgi:hypothetical protein